MRASVVIATLTALAIAGSAAACGTVLEAKPDESSGDAAPEADPGDGARPPVDAGDASPCVGRCPPQVLVFGPRGALGLAVAGDSIYYTNFDVGFVQRIRKSDGADAGMIATNVPNANEIAFHAGHVYFTTGAATAGLFECPVERCATPRPIATLETGEGVATDGTSVVAVSRGGDVVRCALPGCTTASIIAHTLSGAGVTISNGRVHWTSGGLQGVVQSAALDGGDRVTHAGGLTLPHGVLVVGGHVFVAQHVAGIQRVALDGGETSVFTDIGGAIHLASDGRYLYWTDYADGTPGKGAVRRCPIVGCGPGGPETLASELDSPWQIAVDDVYVYWTSYRSAAAITRAPR